MHLVKVHQRKRNTSNVSSTRVAHFLYSALRRVKYGLFFISDQISTALFSAFSHLSLNVLLVMQIAEFWFVSYYTNEHL